MMIAKREEQLEEKQMANVNEIWETVCKDRQNT